MICPECRMENPAEVTECIRCGHPLQSPKQPVNQVWNTDIDRAQNQKNSRTALIALGVVAVLILALIAAVVISLPSMGDALIGQREPGQSFSARLEDFFDVLTDTFGSREPIPEAYAAIAEGPDEDFIDLTEKFLDKYYNKDYSTALQLPDKYYNEFEEIAHEPFSDGQLAVCATQLLHALDLLRSSVDSFSDDPDDVYVADYILQLEGSVELYSVVEDLYEQYGILYADDYIPEYYIWILPIYEAQLEVEKDLTAQLIGIDAEVSDDYAVPYITYTNNTIYELDITFFNDYETADDYFYEDCSFESVMPGETIVIQLWEMPEEFEAWYTDWIVDTCYLNGVDIYDYYW